MKRDTGWLLDKRPPYPLTRWDGERALWWAVIQRSAHDLRFGSRSDALDALDFLRSTGQWLSEVLFNVPVREYQEAVALLVLHRNRFHHDSLDLI